MKISCSIPRTGTPQIIVYLTPDELSVIDPHRTGRVNVRLDVASRTVDLMPFTDVRDSTIRNYAIGTLDSGRSFRVQFTIPPNTPARFAAKADARVLISGVGMFTVDVSAILGDVQDEPVAEMQDRFETFTEDRAEAPVQSAELVALDDTQSAMAETMIGTLRELVERRMISLSFDGNGMLRGRVKRKVVQTVEI